MPFGQLFTEVQADALLEIDFNGKVISQAKEGYNPTGHVIHGAIYAARKDECDFSFSHT